MKFTTLRLSNFQSFSATPTPISLADVTYVLGPNGSGKTAVLEAISRLFSPVAAQRKIQLSDFHVPAGRSMAEVQDEGAQLWIEVDIEFAETGRDGQHASVPPNFSHMAIKTADGVPQIRVRLTAELAMDGEIDEKIEYVLEADPFGRPESTAAMSRSDRGHIEVHYLPARRDPTDHIAYTTTSLIGRTLRAADWTQERTTLADLTTQITDALVSNSSVASVGVQLAEQWKSLHKSAFFADPSIAFGRGEIDGVLRQLTITFSPSHDGSQLPFERLSDGQKSLLYISLVLSWQVLARKVLTGEESSFNPDKLRPPVHTIIALEEPENSLAPQYLGRITRQLRGACKSGDVQALIATHAPTLLRRVHPEEICFLRLNGKRETTIHRIQLPEDDQDAAKYVQEAVEAYPELYFSRLVVLGEGASEQVVLPRMLAAAGIAEEDASVSVVPLGGRHVNHFWRLLNELQIPHVTLLDLDSGRYGGGWGRVRNALKQINKIKPGTYAEKSIEGLPKWNDEADFPVFNDPLIVECEDEDKGKGPVWSLEQHGVFFSNPVDLDLLMMEAFPDAYAVTPAAPDEKTIVAVLGKSHSHEERLGSDVLSLFNDYHAKFDLKSKPATHLEALSTLEDHKLMEDLPDVLVRLIGCVRTKLSGLPE